MLVCPHCSQPIARPKTTAWFDCPHCKLPVRGQAKKDGTVWLEPGSRPGVVRAIEYSDASKAVQQIQLMPLNDVRKLRYEISVRQAQIDSSIKQIGLQIGQSAGRRESTEKYTKVLNELNVEQRNLTYYDQQLMRLEKLLMDERELAVQNASKAGEAAGCGAIAMGIGLFVFGMVASVTWDWKTIGLSILIIAITAIGLFMVATPVHRDQ